MYTGTADHSLTAELVALVDVPVIASGDIVSRASAEEVLGETGAAAVMVGRAAQGNPWTVAEIAGARTATGPSREEVVAELLLFIEDTVREMGERARDRIPEEVLRLVPRPRALPEAVQAGARPARDDRRGARSACSPRRPAPPSCSTRCAPSVPTVEHTTLDLPVSIYAGGTRSAAPPGTGVRRGTLRPWQRRHRRAADRHRPHRRHRQLDRDRRAARARALEVPDGRGAADHGHPDPALRRHRRRSASGTRSSPSSARRSPTRTTPSAPSWPRSRSSARSPATPRRCATPTSVELSVRIGVNTGPVVIPADDGADIAERMNALGDTVNVASRIQELAPAGEVAIAADDGAIGRGLLRARGARPAGARAARARPSRRSACAACARPSGRSRPGRSSAATSS